MAAVNELNLVPRKPLNKTRREIDQKNIFIIDQLIQQAEKLLNLNESDLAIAAFKAIFRFNWRALYSDIVGIKLNNGRIVLNPKLKNGQVYTIEQIKSKITELQAIF